MRRLTAVLRRRRLDAELADEIRLHLELRRQALIDGGLEPAAAEREARRLFGNVTVIREETRDMWTLPALDSMLQDVRYALRLLRRAPLFALVAVTSLAIGIAASTLVFSIVNATLFSWLAMYRNPDRLVMVWQTRNADIWTPTPADFRDWRAANRSFSGIDAYAYGSVNLTGAGEPERLLAASVTPGIFATLGVAPSLGRTFTPDEETWGRHRRVILSDGLWRQRFGANPSVTSRTVTLDGQLHDIVGVMPPGAWFAGTRPDIWVPLAFAPDDPSSGRNSHFIQVVARLRDDVRLEQANSDLAAIAARAAELHPANRGLSARAVSLEERVLGDTTDTMAIVSGAVALLLLIACANVAGLLLVRASTRERELAIRAALGAGPRRVVRQLLTESVLLAVLGGLAGTALAFWAASHAAALLPMNLPRLHETGVPVDWRILAFATAVTFAVGIAAGVLPALAAGSIDALTALKEGGRSATASGRQLRLRALFVAAEITIALVLVTGAALLTRSLGELLHTPIGVRTSGLLTMRIPLVRSETRQADPAATAAYLASIVERVRSIPGIIDADVTSHLPLTGGGQSKYFHVVGRTAAATLEETPVVSVRQEGPRALHALGVRLVAGRLFTHDDTAVNARVALVNETLAHRFFPGETPVGKVITLEPPEHLAPPDFLQAAGGTFVRWTIVGVVADVRYGHPALPAEAVVHVPYQQRTPAALMAWAPDYLVIHTFREPSSVVPEVRASIHQIAPAQPVAEIRTVETIVRATLRQAIVVTGVLGLFSAVALFLTAVGIYGVVASAVTQRSHEIGVRMALGARAGTVIWLVVRQPVTIAAFSVVAGIGVAVVSARILSSQLYGVTPTDSAAFVAASLTVIVVTACAAWLPARRAARVDPLEPSGRSR